MKQQFRASLARVFVVKVLVLGLGASCGSNLPPGADAGSVRRCCESTMTGRRTERTACEAAELSFPLSRCAEPALDGGTDGGTLPVDRCTCGNGTVEATEECEPEGADTCSAGQSCVGCRCVADCGAPTQPGMCQSNTDCGQGERCLRCQCSIDLGVTVMDSPPEITSVAVSQSADRVGIKFSPFNVEGDRFCLSQCSGIRETRRVCAFSEGTVTIELTDPDGNVRRLDSMENRSRLAREITILNTVVDLEPSHVFIVYSEDAQRRIRDRVPDKGYVSWSEVSGAP